MRSSMLPFWLLPCLEPVWQQSQAFSTLHTLRYPTPAYLNMTVPLLWMPFPHFIHLLLPVLQCLAQYQCTCLCMCVYNMCCVYSVCQVHRLCVHTHVEALTQDIICKGIEHILSRWNTSAADQTPYLSNYSPRKERKEGRTWINKKKWLLSRVISSQLTETKCSLKCVIYNTQYIIM